MKKNQNKLYLLIFGIIILLSTYGTVFAIVASDYILKSENIEIKSVKGTVNGKPVEIYQNISLKDGKDFSYYFSCEQTINDENGNRVNEDESYLNRFSNMMVLLEKININCKVLSSDSSRNVVCNSTKDLEDYGSVFLNKVDGIIRGYYSRCNYQSNSNIDTVIAKEKVKKGLDFLSKQIENIEKIEKGTYELAVRAQAKSGFTLAETLRCSVVGIIDWVAGFFGGNFGATSNFFGLVNPDNVPIFNSHLSYDFLGSFYKIKLDYVWKKVALSRNKSIENSASIFTSSNNKGLFFAARKIRITGKDSNMNDYSYFIYYIFVRGELTAQYRYNLKFGISDYLVVNSSNETHYNITSPTAQWIKKDFIGETSLKVISTQNYDNMYIELYLKDKNFKVGTYATNVSEYYQE